MSNSTAPPDPVRPDSEETLIADERTPLLAQGTSTVPTAGGDPHAVSRIASSPAKSPAATAAEDKPLPKFQIILLCYARLVEPIAFFSIFPYINTMVQVAGDLPESRVGFYSGLIESLFSLTQMIVMIFWGWTADRLGRKPVLVFSLVGVSLATGLFGFAKTIPQMIVFRCIAGVFAGTIVTIRTMIAEHSTQKTQAVSFSWFAFSGNLGIFIGPLIGGVLADPAVQYPSKFSGIWLFEEYPYALSSLVVGGIGLTSVITSALFLKETLVKAKPKSSSQEGDADDEEAHAVRERPLSTLELLRSPGVLTVLYNYGHVMVLAFAYTAVTPVFWFTSAKSGGLGFTYMQISLFMGLSGLSQAVWILLFFPSLNKRYGTVGLLRACGVAYPLFIGVMPFLNLILRLTPDHAQTPGFWAAVAFTLAIGPGVSMAFTGVQLALNDVSPSPSSLGSLNALALTLISGLRSFSPALFTSIFAVGVDRQILWGYLVWLVIVILAAGFTVSTRLLPELEEEKDVAGDAEPMGPGSFTDDEVSDDAESR